MCHALEGNLLKGPNYIIQVYTPGLDWVDYSPPIPERWLAVRLDKIRKKFPRGWARMKPTLIRAVVEGMEPDHRQVVWAH